MRTVSLLTAALLAAPLPGLSQARPRADSTPGARRDPTNTLPLATTRTARFTADAGTWMSVDVSPDGSTIAFDLLGDIYTVPIAGGKATRIIGGNSVDMHPRFSPDGKSIAFVSDRNGTDATWVAGADGQRIRLLTNGGVYPLWTPDGRQIVTGNRLVDVNGGAGIPLTGVTTASSFTGDGRYLWFQTGAQAARYDRSEGTITYRTNVPGGVLRPIVTRDGKRLAYFTRFEARSALVVRDLASGQEAWVAMGTQPEAYTPPPPFQFPGPLPPGFTPPPPPPPPGLAPLPTSAWLPDERSLVTAYDGKLWRIEVPSGRTTPIPFSADVEQSLGPLVRGTMEVGDSVVAREIREPSLSPDGRRVAWSSFGKIWYMDLPNGTPRRLTSATTAVELSPVWTLDGSSITYATWVDAEGGDIMQVTLSGGPPRNLTRAPAMYSRLAYTRDGSRLVFARAPRHAWTAIVNETGVQPRTPAGAGTEIGLELRWMAGSAGTQHTIAMVNDVGGIPVGAQAHFTADTSRVFFHDGSALVSVAWDGSDRRVVLARATPHTLLAPNGTHVISRAGPRRHIYLFERPQVTDSIVIDPTAATPVVPARRLTRAGGDFPSFSRDGAKAVWSHGSALYVYDIAQGDRSTSDSIARGGAQANDTTRRAPAADSLPRWTPAYEATRYDIRLALAADKPSGSLVLRGARVVTMKGNEIIENGDVVVTGNRVTGAGPRGSVSIPRGARTIDVTGKTIVPGLVDVHANLGAPSQVHRTVVSPYLANVAFGVTTARDPEAPSTDVFTYADRVALGQLTGPRVFATGPVAVDSAAALRTTPEARGALAPYAEAFRSGAVRGELNASRADRQRFLIAARELGLTTVATGAPDFRKSLSAILDGYASHQGAYEIFPLHDDAAKLIAESGLTYVPMLLGRVGARNGIEHLLSTDWPHDDPRVRRFFTHRDLDRLTRSRFPWIAADEYPFDLVAAGAKRIVANGGRVAVGTGGRVQGLAMHWEMWLLAKGGLSAHDVLRAATSWGAEALGLGAQLGSIETGKLADLVILDANPLADIRNSSKLRYVMKNGRLYDAATLDQVAPTRQTMAPLWWTAAEPKEENR